MLMLLGEVRRLIEEVLLTETRVLGDPSEAIAGKSYRAYLLGTFSDTPETRGNMIIVPSDMPRYARTEKGHISTAGGVENYIRKVLGLNPEINGKRDESKPYYHLSETDALVVDHEAQTVDLDSGERSKNMNRRPGKMGGGRKQYTIPHGDTSFEHVTELQKVLKALMHVDKRLTADYMIVGSPNFEESVGDVLRRERPGDAAVRGGQAKPLVFYHGTSDKRLPGIKAKGLRPGSTPETYVDLVAGYSEHNVYLATTVTEAENYATRAAVDDNGKAVVLRVVVRDPTHLIMDEDNTNWINVTNPKGEEVEVHFKHDYWRKWPNADQIMQMYMAKLAKSLNKSGTVAYRGRIPASDISVFSTYKPASMKKDPEWAEFADAKQRTLDTYERNVEKPSRTAARPVPSPAAVPVAKSEPVEPETSGEKTYKVYGKLKGAPAHTRLKGKAYVAAPGTKFKPGEQAKVAPKDGKLQVKKADGDHTQLWEPE